MHSKQALFHSAEIFKNRIYFGEQKYIFSGHLELSKTVPKKGSGVIHLNLLQICVPLSIIR